MSSLENKKGGRIGVLLGNEKGGGVERKRQMLRGVEPPRTSSAPFVAVSVGVALLRQQFFPVRDAGVEPGCDLVHVLLVALVIAGNAAIPSW